MTEILTQLGVGGILIVVVLREVFAFLGKQKKQDETDKVSRSECNDHRSRIQYLDNCTEIVKRMDGQFRFVKDELVEIKELVRSKA